MHGHAAIEKQRFVCAAQIMQPQTSEAELARLADKFFRGVVRVPQLRKREILAQCRQASEAMLSASKPPPSTPAPRPVENSRDEGPYRVHVQTRSPDPERGDPGEIAEGTYTISGDLVCVRDDQGRELGSEVLRPGSDPAVVARSILRTKKAPVQFWNPIPYRTH
jgi:hypothetical protein